MKLWRCLTTFWQQDTYIKKASCMRIRPLSCRCQKGMDDHWNTQITVFYIWLCDCASPIFMEHMLIQFFVLHYKNRMKENGQILKKFSTNCKFWRKDPHFLLFSAYLLMTTFLRKQFLLKLLLYGHCRIRFVLKEGWRTGELEEKGF